MKIHAFLLVLLVLLTACGPTVVEKESKPVVRDTRQPIKETQELETEPVPAPTPVAEPQPAPEPIASPTKPVEPAFKESAEQKHLSQTQSCIEACQQDCTAAAINSCKQRFRSECKARCGDIIDPSACTQACTYISQPQQCKTQFEQFCNAQCVGLCR